MDHKQRRELIKQVISDQRVSTQEQLISLLQDAGVVATQATISRDLRALNVVKVSGEGGESYYARLEDQPGPQTNQRLYDAIANTVVGITQVQFINVINTTPNTNYATILAGFLDDSGMKEVVGTLAGNDTLITISKTPEDAKVIYDLVVLHQK